MQSHGRTYAPGRTLKNSTIDLMKEYNTHDDLKGAKGDKKFIEILMREMFGRTEIMKENLDQNVVNLVKGIINFCLLSVIDNIKLLIV